MCGCALVSIAFIHHPSVVMDRKWNIKNDEKEKIIQDIPDSVYEAR